MLEPIWIRLETVLAIHKIQIAEHGGMHGVRNLPLLESALARPRQLLSYENPTLDQLGAAYGYGIIRNHPFVDGNKRTGLVTLGLFLQLNGKQFVASEEEAFLSITAAAAGEIAERQFMEWVERNAR
ncbi:MAG TPA: type II toxin-antitoxin system death-on-curing family toxin [Gemmataceae bacterium]|jgi:death-on-curing protein|nr:type II toxin-antitoxin system death-on-curing family toxin [Gemmataceae bacterium]